MSNSRRFISLAVGIGAFSVLYFYLSETLIYWRVFLSLLVFIATYVMLDGFLRRG